MSQIPVGANLYGDGSDGSLSISSNTTDSPIDSTCSGTSGTTSLTATNASFAAGQVILILQVTGGTHTWELNAIDSYTAGTITTTHALANSYTHSGDTRSQVVVVKQHSSITVDNGSTLTAKAWDQSNGTGGVLALLCSGTIDINGAVTAGAKGFEGGEGGLSALKAGWQGQGEDGVAPVAQGGANSTGAGGGQETVDSGSGGGGGHVDTGSSGSPQDQQGDGGLASDYDSSDLSSMLFGGAGGGGGNNNNSADAGDGGNGGGIIFLMGPTFDLTGGSIDSDGEAGGPNTGDNNSAGGGGAGGSVLIKGDNVTIGTDLVTVDAGAGGAKAVPGNGSAGGAGDVGIIRVEYGTSLSGSISSNATTSEESELKQAFSKDSSVKASMMIVGDKDNSAKANIAATSTNDNSAKAGITTAFGHMLAKGNVAGIDMPQVSSAKAHIRKLLSRKKYQYRIYTGNTYVTSWSDEVLSEPRFRMVINGGLGEMVIKLARDFDDFGEDSDVKLHNRVKVYCYDIDSFTGVLIYDGYISGYRPVLNEYEEFIEVTLLHYTTEMHNIMLRSGSDTQVIKNSTDPAQMMKDVIDLYRLDGGLLRYTETSIDDTSTTVSYTFNTNTVKEAMDKIIELAPQDWYWRVNPDLTVEMHLSNMNTATHTFAIGKQINNLETWRRAEDIVNTVYFVGQEDAGTPMYRVYSNSGSIDSYGIHARKVVDQRVTVTGTADSMANRVLNQKINPEIRTIVTILDNNGQDKDKGYDIESIKPGDTMIIQNIKQGTKTTTSWDQSQWDVDVWDQTLTNTAADIIQIQAVEYNPNFVRIEASSRLPEISKRIEDINRNLETSQTWNAPATPTAG